MKNKKIKTIALAGGLSVVCLSSILFSNAGNCKSLFYPAIIKSATQDLSNKELTQSYYKSFEESKFYDALIKEFNEIESFSIEETKTDITFDISVHSDEVFENEKILHKEMLNNLFDSLSAINSKKDIRFEITVGYKYDKDKEYIKQHTSDMYRICKNKFDKNSLAVIKTEYSNIPATWDTYHYIYNIKENSLDREFDDKSTDSYYTPSIYDIYPYEVEKTTYYEKDSVSSSLYLRLSDSDFEKSNPKKLVDTLAEELSTDDNIESILISVKSKDEDEHSKFYSATLDKTGKVAEYDFD